MIFHGYLHSLTIIVTHLGQLDVGVEPHPLVPLLLEGRQSCLVHLRHLPFDRRQPTVTTTGAIVIIVIVIGSSAGGRRRVEEEHKQKFAYNFFY